MAPAAASATYEETGRQAGKQMMDVSATQVFNSKMPDALTPLYIELLKRSNSSAAVLIYSAALMRKKDALQLFLAEVYTTIH